MTDAFTHHYFVDYSDVDDKLTLRPSHLVEFLQNIAILHSNTAGYDLNWFKENHKGWVLTHWHIRISRLPKESEELTLQTWSAPYKRARANRDFLLEDASGREICYASSRWVLIDTQKRRPIKFDEEFFQAYTGETLRTFRPESFSFPQLPEEVPQGSRSFVVTRRDTDTNGHANNAAYIDWAIDDIPDALYANHHLEDIRATYKKECLKGDQVRSSLYIRPLDPSKKEIISIFEDKHDPTKIFCEVSTIWRRVD
ncbi:MAG: thioesterase [Anaerovoracaceae bacterium]